MATPLSFQGKRHFASQLWISLAIFYPITKLGWLCLVSKTFSLLLVLITFRTSFFIVAGNICFFLCTCLKSELLPWFTLKPRRGPVFTLSLVLNNDLWHKGNFISILITALPAYKWKLHMTQNTYRTIGISREEMSKKGWSLSSSE